MVKGIVALLVVAGTFASPVSAAWIEANSRHFTVYADSDPQQIQAFVEKLERFDAAVREARGVPDVNAGAASRVTVYQLRDVAELRRVYGDKDSGVAGFYIPRASGSVAFVPRRMETGKWRVTADGVFFHEYTHHLMLQSANSAMPAWLTEGTAEFFATPIFNTDGSVTVGHPPRHRAGGVLSNWSLSLEKMVSGDFETAETYDWVSTVYARGWLLTHYLAYNQERRGQLPRYLAAIQAGVPARKAAQDSFGDLRKLEKELDAYLKKGTFTVSTIPADKIKIAPIELRTLRPGEAAIMRYKIRLERGNQKAFARGIASSLASMATTYGDDPAVLTTSAQADILAGQYARAAANAAKAVAVDPKNVSALLALGDAKAGVAKSGGSTNDWDEVRQAYSKANRLDPENAAPLAGFYNSFVEQGIAPTKNAIEGLRYAVLLTPQDIDLRLMLVEQLTKDRQFKDATDVLATVAYDPDSERWHKIFNSIMVPLAASDQAGALTAIKVVKARLEKERS